MDSSASKDVVLGMSTDKESIVDPFLVEALQNPRHRLTILRMEFDIQRFFQNVDQQLFEFQHFPTSYLRLAAHRVAQHYGLQTMVQDSGLDGQGNRILVRKTPESKYPAVRLSEIPAKRSENDKLEQVKIVIRSRPNRTLSDEANKIKKNPVRSVEERKEEYDRARARIFSSPSSPEYCGTLPQISTDEKTLSLSRVDNESCRNSGVDPEKSLNIRESSTSFPVAIFRDREKDRIDPDYDRSYNRYVRNLPNNQSFSVAPFNMQGMQPTFVHYDPAFSQLGQMPRTPSPLSYGPPSNPAMNPFCALGLNQTSRDAACVQWSTAAMMYAHSYEQFRPAGFQAPFCQQPLSFDYSQNH